MCGIVGFCSEKNDVLPHLLKGLSRLEYRGYDSAGVALLNGGIHAFKKQGRLENLCKLLEGGEGGSVGIGHTRWATHGVPSDENAHPHLSRSKRFAIVHNGIIENYIALKEFLLERSFEFFGDTDTETIAHLIEYYYRGDVVDAMIKTAQRLKGSYALGVLCADFPGMIFAMRKDSPLVVGMSYKKPTLGMLASDMSALLEYTRDFVIPDEGEIAVIMPQDIKILNFNREIIEKKIIHAEWDNEAAQKQGFPHFMLKEIYEQPKAIRDTLSSLKTKIGSLETLKNIKRISIIGCGSAYHAGLMGKYLFEKLARIPTDIDIASEFRYKEPIIEGNTLTIAISQSGETADTIAALREAKKQCKVLSIVNVPGSSIARLSDEVVYTLAGPEISVATTKGYLCQVVALWAIAFDFHENQMLGDSLAALPADIEELLASKEQFQQLAARFFSEKTAFFIGRGVDYAVAMEGALKLKEISYIHVQCYPAGELKHGTISLIENGSLVVVICTDKSLMEKTLSNIMEVKSRGAVVFALTCFDEVIAASDYHAKIKEGQNAPLLASVSLQLFAYYVALARNCDVDKPRHLAKSVTVE